MAGADAIEALLARLAAGEPGTSLLWESRSDATASSALLIAGANQYVPPLPDVRTLDNDQQQVRALHKPAGFVLSTPMSAAFAFGNDDVLEALLQSVEGDEEAGRGLWSESHEENTEAARALRIMLSEEERPPLRRVREAGLVPGLVRLCAPAMPDVVKQEAAWALLNVASGSMTDTTAVVNAGGLAAFVELLDEGAGSSVELMESAVWGIGNIAGDMAALALATPAMSRIIAAIQRPDATISLKRIAAWTLSNLSRRSAAPAWHLLEPLQPVVARFLSLEDGDDDELYIDAAWCARSLRDCNPLAAQAWPARRVGAGMAQMLEKDPATDRLLQPLAMLVDVLEGTGALQAAAELVSDEAVGRLFEHYCSSDRFRTARNCASLLAALIPRGRPRRVAALAVPRSLARLFSFELDPTWVHVAAALARWRLPVLGREMVLAGAVEALAHVLARGPHTNEALAALQDLAGTAVGDDGLQAPAVLRRLAAAGYVLRASRASASGGGMIDLGGLSELLAVGEAH